MTRERRAVLGWAAYDWANSAFATTVMAGFFPIFFKEYWSRGADVNTSTAMLGIGNSLASLAVAFLSPILVPATVGSMPDGRGPMAPGAACCGPMACCAPQASCAAGGCESGASLGATHGRASSAGTTTPAPGPRLASACPGPAPATTVVDRDPALPSPAIVLPIAAEPRHDALHAAAAAPVRNDAPSVPPPRV